jgi:bacterioferritin
MAKESILILRKRIDLPELLSQLNAALSEEWLAFYQYWIGSLVVEGAMRSDVQREFEAHAMEEFGHARALADRIIQLEGTPVLDPVQWGVLARCKYSVPLDADVMNLLKQNIAAERCAVVRYEEIDALEYVEQGVDGRRISGFASPRLSLGSFRNDTLGSYTRYTYTKQTACILLSVGERSIVIGCESEEQTRAVYDALCARIEQ